MNTTRRGLFRAAAGSAAASAVAAQTTTRRTSKPATDPSYAETITLLEADVLDPGLPERVGELLGGDARCMLVEDSAHTYETTRAALDGFAHFVARGGFIVVEDGCVDIEPMRADPDWPRGVLPAIADWLASPPGQGFVVRRDLEIYGITCHPQGFLQRTPR